MTNLEIFEEGPHWVAFPDPNTTIAQIVAACRDLNLVPILDPEDLRLGLTQAQVDAEPPHPYQVDQALYGPDGADYLVETGRFARIPGDDQEEVG